VAQVGWVVLALLGLPVSTFFVAAAGLFAVELVGPVLAERRSPTPWHAHHIAERHGLLALITLGEGVLGTVAALNALVHTEHGWTVNAALLAVAGIGLTFGIWWMYFLVPWGEVLALHRERAYLWGTGHLLLFGSIAATGAGLHVGAYLLEGAPTLDTTATVLTVAVPVAVFVLALYAIGSVFLRQRDPVPPAAAGRYRGRAGARRGLRRAGHERVVVSDGANARAPRVGARLRDGRSPAAGRPPCRRRSPPPRWPGETWTSWSTTPTATGIGAGRSWTRRTGLGSTR